MFGKLTIGQGLATLLASRAALEVSAGQFKSMKNLFQDCFYDIFLIFDVLLWSMELFRKFQMLLAGHIKALGGPYVARGPDVAQACYRGYP